jgi:protease I
MATIAVIIDDLFEDSEYTEPVKAFAGAGHRVVHVGLTAGATVRGKKAGTEVRIDRAVRDASPAEFDALLIPGGYSPDRLRAHRDAVAFAGDFMRSGKPVFVICHGAQLLITAQALKGRRITGYRSIIQDIVNAGAEFVDGAAVRDGNLISSRDPGDLPAFIRAALEALQHRGGV